MQRNIGIALGLLSLWVASEYSPMARFANHTSAYDSEIAATQKALKNLRTTTSLSFTISKWLRCPVNERTIMIVAPLPRDSKGIEIERSRLFKRYFVQREKSTTVDTATCTQLDAASLMKGIE
jgi:hypothetical protein